jgi:ppGpp synthetase/RelA/SpoT-type nucleotidyltranferase
MKRTSSEARRAFVAQYKKDLPELYRQAYVAERAVKEAIAVPSLGEHVVFSRPKDPESLRLKIIDKNYSDPAFQVTDKIGVRVITYYSTDVDKVVDAVKKSFEVDLERSIDKRQQLGLRDFGYRSVHLIVRLKTVRLEYKELATEWFEIQVRSILEHAWAEIEHEVVYKSKITYPDSVKRNFAMLAGVLELLDNQFELLRIHRDQIIQSHRNSYANRREGNIELDPARLIAFFEYHFPVGLGWRKASADGTPFPARIEVKCLMALMLTSIKSANQLEQIIKSARYKTAIKMFANKQGIRAPEVSHLTLAMLAIATKDIAIVQEFFPDFVSDPAFAAGLAGLARKPMVSRIRRRT